MDRIKTEIGQHVPIPEGYGHNDAIEDVEALAEIVQELSEKVKSGGNFHAEALQAYERAYRLVKMHGEPEDFGDHEDEPEPESQPEAGIPDTHKYGAFSPDQLSTYYGGGRKVEGFKKSFESAEEAMAYADAADPSEVILIGELFESADGEMIARVRYTKNIED